MLWNCSVPELCYMPVKHAVRQHDDSFDGGRVSDAYLLTLLGGVG